MHPGPSHVIPGGRRGPPGREVAQYGKRERERERDVLKAEDKKTVKGQREELKLFFFLHYNTPAVCCTSPSGCETKKKQTVRELLMPQLNAMFDQVTEFLLGKNIRNQLFCLLKSM